LGLQKPLICGFADGACIALQMAIWEPDLAAAYVFMSAWLWNAKAVSKRGLVLMQDFFGIEQPVREQLTEHDLEGVENKHSPAIQYLQEGYPDGWDRTYWKKYLTDIWPAWSTLTEHGADELQRIVAPSLVVVGDRDPFIPLHETVEFFQHLPNAELAVVPGTGHEALSTDHAPRVSRIILDFLQRQRWDQPRYIDDEGYRRRILVQLNRGEGRHRLARAVFHGQRGELRQRYREGQEDQLGALGLVVNAIVLWNTRYIERALRQLEHMGLEVRPEDVERIWPLGFQHINMLGRYSFDLPEQLTRGELRSLRDPSDAADDEVLVA
jgi:esterase/lipase